MLIPRIILRFEGRNLDNYRTPNRSIFFCIIKVFLLLIIFQALYLACKTFVKSKRSSGSSCKELNLHKKSVHNLLELAGMLLNHLSFQICYFDKIEDALELFFQEREVWECASTSVSATVPSESSFVVMFLKQFFR